MRELIAAIALSGAVLAPIPAHADLVITGRDAQALHCAALWTIATAAAAAEGLPRSDVLKMQLVTLIFLDHVPGTERQKKQALEQRITKLVATGDGKKVGEDFEKTAPWCQKTFLA